MRNLLIIGALLLGIWFVFHIATARTQGVTVAGTAAQ
jgi:hypothetical protein